LLAALKDAAKVRTLNFGKIREDNVGEGARQVHEDASRGKDLHSSASYVPQPD
jgi:hypothetical protein